MAKKETEKDDSSFLFEWIHNNSDLRIDIESLRTINDEKELICESRRHKMQRQSFNWSWNALIIYRRTYIWTIPALEYTGCDLLDASELRQVVMVAPFR